MPRGPRVDEVGLDFHVMNRGTARRTVFEGPRDFRYFISRLAYAVRRKEIEVVAFSLLMTHYHIQVRSLGHLSEAFRRIQNEYVRHFNRSRRRDGALFRGRFVSRPIRSRTHFKNAYHYIDENPVQARLVSRPEQWPWGSASRFHSGKPCSWLSSRGRDGLAVRYGPEGTLAPDDVREARAGFVEARLVRGSRVDDLVDGLFSGLPHRVRSWMISKALLADGTEPGLPLAGAERVLAAVAAHTSMLAGKVVKLPGTKTHPLSRVVCVALLRDLAALRYSEIARYVQRSSSNAKALYDLHCRAVLEQPPYAEIALCIAQWVIAPLCARNPGREIT